MNKADTKTRKNMRTWFGMRFDRKYGYVTQECTPGKESELFRFFREHRDIKLQYIDGCFYPYLITTKGA
jgi:hypothetical protein